MKKTSRFLTLILVLVLVFSMAACGEKAPVEENSQPTNPVVPTPPPAAEATKAPTSAAEVTADSNATYGGTFTSNRSVSPSGGLFSIYRSCGDVYIAPAVERLIRLDANTQEIVPLLAKSVDFNTEKNQITLKLQENVKFHDGSDMTAEIVKWNLEFMIENGQGGTIRNPSKIECPDEHTVVISYNEFYLDAPQTLSKVGIYSKKTYDEKGLDYCLTHPVGTGAFVFDEYIPDNIIKYVRNENYWQEGLPYLDGWNVLITNDAQTLMAAFANGEVTCMNNGNPAVAQAMVDMGYEIKTADCHSTRAFWGCMVNNRVEGDPWNDLRVRQAVLLYGLDYANMTRTMGYPAEWETKQFNGSDALLYDEELDKPTYDLEKAKEMLAEAGYSEGFTTNIYTITTYAHAATIYQAELKKLGIEANVVTLNNSDPIFFDGTTPGMFMVMNIGAYDALNGIVDRYFAPDSTSYGKHIQHLPEYAETYAKANASKTWEERAEYGKRIMEMLIYDECVVVNAFYNNAFHFIQDYAHDSGFEYNTYLPEITWMEEY